MLFGIILASALLTSACSRQDRRLQQHRDALESLGATTAFVGEAWLSGQVSGTYARTALEEAFQLVEQERTALASSPQALLDPRGAQLSQAAERLSRLLALMMDDVSTADGSALRRHVAEIPIKPPQRP
jgi:hypothetical protein